MRNSKCTHTTFPKYHFVCFAHSCVPLLSSVISSYLFPPSPLLLLPQRIHCCQNVITVKIPLSKLTSPLSFPPSAFPPPPPSALHRFVTPDRPLSYTPPQIPPLLHLHLIIDSCLQVNILSLPSHPSLTQPSSSV